MNNLDALKQLDSVIRGRKRVSVSFTLEELGVLKACLVWGKWVNPDMARRLDERIQQVFIRLRKKLEQL